MAIEFKRTNVSGSQPTIWRGEAKMLPGGFKPLQSFPVGTVIERGVPLYVDFGTMSAAVCKTARVVAGGTTTKIRVAKGHVFQAGDIVMKDGVTDKYPAISSIDTTNADYDIITVASAITGVAADDILVEASVEGSTAAAKYTPNAVLGAVAEFKSTGLPALDAAYEANVLYAHLSVPYLPKWVENGMCLKTNHSIKLIRQ